MEDLLYGNYFFLGFLNLPTPYHLKYGIKAGKTLGSCQDFLFVLKSQIMMKNY
jgi:hypothetical protein